MYSKTRPRLNQTKSWTRTGVPRKNQMYDHAIDEVTGFFDRRITASRMPPTTPITIDRTVSSSVWPTPLMIRSSKK